MQQFTVYAGTGEQSHGQPAYVVNFTSEGPVVYAMNEDWEERAREIERGLSRSARNVAGDSTPRLAGGNSPR